MKKIAPFSYAMFDLDGTLLDSLYVWERVDELFFASRNIPLPEGFGKELGGMGYAGSAQYTIERFGLNETVEDIVAEWMELAGNEYAVNVGFKPHGLAYLRALKSMGVRLAVVTAMPRDMFMPCLENHGVVGLFDAICSTDEAGGESKMTGRVYRMAADMMGAKAEDCLVFEDIYEGVMGAKNVGMRAVCVDDPATTHRHEEIAQEAECIIRDFGEMENYHILPKGWKEN